MKTKKPTTQVQAERKVRKLLTEIVDRTMSETATKQEAEKQLAVLMSKALAQQNRTKVVLVRFESAIASNAVELTAPVKLLLKFLTEEFSLIEADAGIPEQFSFKAFMSECQNSQDANQENQSIAPVQDV